MKRITTIIIFTVCVLTIGSWSHARGRGKSYGPGNGRDVSVSDISRGMNYVDNDGDGVCDNVGSRGNSKGRGQGRRFQSKNAPGTASQHGPRYIDKNGDGICDNFVDPQKTE